MKRTSLWQRITALLLAVLLVAGYVPVQQVNAAETAMATVEALSPNLNVGSNGTAGISITATEGFTLQWVAADPSVGRTEDGWWAGFKVIAPEGIDLTGAVYYWNYADGTSSARKFWDVKDSSDDAETHWVGIWKLITPEALNEALQAGKKFTQLWSFDWEGDGTCEQTVSLTLDPTKVILKTGDVQNYPNYGTVSAITSGVSLNATNPAKAELSLAETITLDYDEANPDINRTRSGWWIGVKVVAPQLDVEVLKTATYTRKETNEPDKAREFWKNKDSKDDDQTHWIGLWAYVTPEKLTALEAGEMLTHSWEFNWDNNAGIDQVVTIKLDPAKLILNKDGAQQYPCYGNVSVITGAEVITLTGSGTASALAEVQAPLKTLVWAPADTSIGRYADGWWIGLKVEAPAGFTEAQADQVKYIRGSGENWESWDNARPFSEYKDGPTHITIWAPITEKILADAINAGVEVLSWSWKFDWLNSGDETKMQVVTIQVDPALVELTNKNGDTGFQFPADPLYGTVSWLTDGITVTENASANVSASNEGKTDVVLQWADTSEGRPAEGWWAGIRIDLPEALKGESFDPTGITLQTMGTAGTWSKAIEFKDAYEYDGTSQYLTLWGLINEDRWDTGSDLVYKMRIDWNKDGIYEQLVTLTVDPQNYILKKGDDQVRPHSIGFSVTNGKVNVYGEEYPATITVDYQGGELTYTITPDENYHIQSIQHGDTVLDAFNEADHGKRFTYAFTPDGDVEVTATIVPDQRSFTVVETGKGEVDGNEATTEFSSVDYGTSASCTITAAKGYKAFVGEEVVADGTNGKASGTYTVKNITEDTVVTVEFCPVEYTITYHSPLGEVPAKENYTIETKDQTLAQITGVTGAEFLGWKTKDNVIVDKPSELKDLADIDLYAVFEVTAAFSAEDLADGAWHTGTSAELTVKTELDETVKGEYAYTVSTIVNNEAPTESNATVEKAVQVSFADGMATEVTYSIKTVTFTEGEGENKIVYTYDVKANELTLKQDNSKPEITLTQQNKTKWDSWIDMVLDAIAASNVEKVFEVTTTDTGAGVEKVEYVFAPLDFLQEALAANKKLTGKTLESVLEEGGYSWGAYDAENKINNQAYANQAPHVLIVRVADKVGNVAYADSNGLLFDATAPVINVTYEGAEKVNSEGEIKYYSNGEVIATIEIKDAYLNLPMVEGNEFGYSVTIDGENQTDFEVEDVAETSVVLKLKLSVLDGEDSKKTLIINAKDAAGNPAAKYTAELVLDKKAPKISVSYDPPAPEGGNIYTPNNITVTVTVTDPYLDYANNGFVPTIMLNAQPVTVAEEDIKWSEEHSVWTGSFVIAAESYYGPNAVTVEATDECGNSAEKYTSPTLLIDPTVPVIDVDYAYGNGNPESAQSASDTTADTKSESSFYSNEDIVVTVTLKDDYLDPAENQYTYSIQLDRGEMPKEITWKNDADGNPTASFTLDTETYSGVYTLTVTVKDEAGNETKYDSGKLILDRTAPVIASMTIEKVQSDAEAILNFLTFGIFFNEEIDVIVTVQDELSLNFDGEAYPDQVASAHMHIEGVENPVPGTAVAEKPGEFIFKLPDTVLEEDIEKVITFTATDAAGNTSEPVLPSAYSELYKSDKFLFETKVADVAFTTPSGYAVGEEFWLNDGSSVNLTVTDTTETENGSISGIQSVEIKVNDKEIPVIHKDVTDDDGIFDFTAEKTGEESFTIPYDSLLDGKNKISVAVVDNAGNKTEPIPTYTVYVDRTDLTVDVSYTYANQRNENGEEITVNSNDKAAVIYSLGDIKATITVKDDHLPTDTLKAEAQLYNVLSGENTEISINWTTKTETEWIGEYTIKKEGIYQLNLLNVTDKTGNVTEEAYKSNNLQIDRTVPVIDVDYAYGNGNPESAQSASDTTADTKSESSFYSNEDIVVTVTLKDDYLDPAENQYTYSIQLDRGEMPKEITWKNDADGNPTASFTLDTETYSGVYTLTVTVKDEAGNETKYGSGNLVLDRTAPVIASMTIEKVQSDAEAILNFLTFGIFFNGEIEVTITVKDNCPLNGNETTYPKSQITSALMYIEGVDGATKPSVSDAAAGVFTFKLPDGVLEKDVEKVITFTATDAAGNTCEPVLPSAYSALYKSDKFLFETKVADVDFTTPSGYAVGEEFWLNDGSSVNLTVTDTAETENGSVSGIQSVEIKVNDKEIPVIHKNVTDDDGIFDFTAEKTGEESFTIPYDSLLDGKNKISVAVVDNAGNKTEPIPTYTVYVDRTKPEIDVDYTYQNAGTQKEETENQDAPIYSNGDIIATITITDAHLDDVNKDNAAEGFATVTLTENTATLKLVAGSEKWNEDHTKWTAQYKISSAEKTETVSQLSISVADETGNKATYGSKSLLIDRVVPVITMDYTYTNGNQEGAQTAQDITGDELENNNFYANGDIQVKVTITDNHLDFAGDNEENFPEIQLNGTPAEYQPDWTKGANEWTATYTITPEQVNELTVSVSDEAGNKTNYTSGNLVLDRTAPDEGEKEGQIKIEIVETDPSTLEYVLNFLTFGIFFNHEVEVKVTVSDDLSLGFEEFAFPDDADIKFPEGQVSSVKMTMGEHTALLTEKDAAYNEDSASATFTFTLLAENLLEEDIAAQCSFVIKDAAGNEIKVKPTDYGHSSNTFLYEQKGAKVDFSVPNSYIVKNGEEEQCWLKESTEKIEITVKDELEGKDTSGIRSVEIKLNGEAITVSPDAAGYDFTSKKVTNVVFELNCKAIYNDLKVGANELTVSMVDHAGNSSKDSFTFYKDITCPEIDVDYTYQNAGTQKEETENQDAPIYSNGDIIATITITDAHLDDVNKDNAAEGFATVTLTSSTENKATLELVAGSEKWNEDHTQWTAQYKISSAEKTETVSQLSISVADETGNKATYGSKSLLIDRVVPVITMDYAYTNGNLEGNQTAQDISGSEAMKNFYANGDIQVEITIKDDYLDFAGNNEDKFFPEIQLNGTPAEYQPTWTAGTNEWTATYTITPEQVNELTVSVSDEAGNETDYTSGKLVLDRTAPDEGEKEGQIKIEIVETDPSTLEYVLNFLTFGIFFNHEVEVKVTVSDDLSLGFEEFAFPDDADIKFPEGQVSSVKMTMGENILLLTEKDAAYNADSASATFTFTLPAKDLLEEDIAAQCSFVIKDAAGNEIKVEPTDYDHTSNTFLYETTEAVVNFSANNVAIVTYESNGQRWMKKDQAFTFVVTDLMEGKNTSGIRSVIVTNNGAEVLVSNTDGADSTTGEFYYTGENVKEVKTYQESYSIAYDTLKEGMNVISVKVTDNAGNVMTDGYTVYKDTKEAKVDFTATTYDAETQKWLMKDQTVEIDVVDQTAEGLISGIYKVVITRNDKEIPVRNGSTTANNGTLTYTGRTEKETYTLSYNDLDEGKNEISVKVTDNVGNEVTETYTVYVDKTIPEIIEIAFAPTSPTSPTYKYEEGDHEAFNPVETEYGFYFGQETKVTITANDPTGNGKKDDISGVAAIHYILDDIDNENDQNVVVTSAELQDNAISFTIPANFKGQIYALALDNVKNFRQNQDCESEFVAPDGTIIANSTKHDDAASVTIERAETAWKDHAGHDLYSGDVLLTMNAADTYAGLRTVEWYVELDGRKLAGGEVEIDNSANMTGDTWTLVEQVSNLITKLSRTHNVTQEGTGFKAYLKLTDRIGYTSEVENVFSIDRTAPVCNVTFSEESNPVGDISYHDEPLVATITIDELNFNENDFEVTVNGEATAVDWIPVDGDTHTVTLTFTEDGEYIIGVTGQDMAHNAMEEYTSNTRIVDQNAPAVVTDLQHESANNEETISFTITIADQNLPVENIKAELIRVIRTGNGFTDADFKTETVTLEAPVEIEWDEGRPIAYTITVPNLDTDGYYTLTMTVTDHAGNVTTLINAANTPEGQDGFEAVNFSVNREGSVFMIETEHTDKYAEGAPLKNQLFGAYANDNVKVIIHEINVDQVDIGENQTSLNINDGSSTTDVTLVEGTNYAKNQESGLGGWFENIYTLDNSNFEKDGMYSLSLLTYDKAENSNINTKQTEEGAEPTGTIRFTVDRTNPVISTNVYQDQRINEPQYVVEFQIADANLDESSLVVLVNGEIVSGSALTSLGGNIYQFTITDGLNQTIEITAKDKAKNPSEPCLIENVTVSTNILVLWYANTPLFWGTVGGFVALAALIAWLLIAKKRKEEKAEAK